LEPTVILVLLGNIAQFIILLVTMRVASTYLPPEEMGRLSLIAATTAFYVLLFVNPVGMFINRRLHSWDAAGGAKYYLKLHWAYLLLVSGFATLSIYGLKVLGVLGDDFSTFWILLLVCGSIVFNTINQTAIPLLNLLGFRAQYFSLTLATISLSLLSANILVSTYSPTAEYWQMGLLSGQMVLAVVGVIKLFSKLRPASQIGLITKAHLQKIFVFAWPVAVSVAFNWVQTQGYRFLAVNALGLSMLGLFVAGYGISAGLIAAFESVMTTYFQPEFYKRVSNSNSSDQSMAWNTYAEAVLPALMLVVITLVAIAPELTYFMVGPDYQSASGFVLWGGLAEGSRVVAGVYGMAAHGKMKTTLLVWPNIIGALVCTLIVLLVAPVWGVHGVGFARAVAGVSLVLGMHFLMMKALEIKLPSMRLWMAVISGASLYVFAGASRYLIVGANDLIKAGALISLVGLVFLPVLYWLIHPLLQIKDKSK
jgi:O-antigen/teichoic acid export membrane protein